MIAGARGIAASPRGRAPLHLQRVQQSTMQQPTVMDSHDHRPRHDRPAASRPENTSAAVICCRNYKPPSAVYSGARILHEIEPAEQKPTLTRVTLCTSAAIRGQSATHSAAANKQLADKHRTLVRAHASSGCHQRTTDAM